MKLPELSPQTQIEAQIAFYIGILLGAISGGVMVATIKMAWYFKAFSMVGSVCVIGILSLSLYQLILSRKQLLETIEVMKTIQTTAQPSSKEPVTYAG
jgi:cytochrome c-type biogenesis protein CcmH/NrfG